MSSYEEALKDIHRGRPPQTYPSPWNELASQYGSAVACTIILGYAIHYFSLYLGVSVSSLPSLIWHALLFFIPSRLVLMFGTPSELEGDIETTKMSVSLHTRQKSEVIRKVFGLDGQGLLKNAPGDRIRRLSLLLKGTPGEAPPGLGNWDNSCYQNSVIQGLASIRSLKSFLSRSTTEFRSLPSDSTNNALFETINKLNDPDNAGQRLWTPAKLKSMSSWQQQDAQEYFSKVLDEMEREIITAAKLKTDHDGLGHTAKAILSSNQAKDLQPKVVTEPKDDCSSPESKPIKPVLQNPLEGLLAQRVGCIHCGYSEGLSMIPFNCLTVPLGRSWGYDVTECLDEYTNLEQIEGVTCAKCTLLRTEANIKRLLESGSMAASMTEPRRNNLIARLQTVQQALEDDDFSDNTIVKKCDVPKKNWVSSTKSRQAVVARTPKALVIHVNRSMFDEFTGAQLKNYAGVSFPKYLDLSPWCLGGPVNVDGSPQTWTMDPNQSMISKDSIGAPNACFELRSVVTHYGRHENGHYINYRPDPFTQTDAPIKSPSSGETEPEEAEAPVQQWWCLSDEDVSRVTEEHVLQQGGVFMLFYEQVDFTSLNNMYSEERFSEDIAMSNVSISKTEPLRNEVQPPEMPKGGLPTQAVSQINLPVQDTPFTPIVPPLVPESVSSTQSTREDSPQYSDTSSQADTEATDDTAQTEVDTTLGKGDAKEIPQSGSVRMRTAPPSSPAHGEDAMSQFRMVAAT